MSFRHDWSRPAALENAEKEERIREPSWKLKDPRAARVQMAFQGALLSMCWWFSCSVMSIQLFCDPVHYNLPDFCP